MNDPRLHTEGVENTFTHEVLTLPTSFSSFDTPHEIGYVASRVILLVLEIQSHF